MPRLTKTERNLRIQIRLNSPEFERTSDRFDNAMRAISEVEHQVAAEQKVAGETPQNLFRSACTPRTALADELSTYYRGASARLYMPDIPRWSYSVEHAEQFRYELVTAVQLERLKSSPFSHLLPRPAVMVDAWGQVVPGKGGRQSGLVHPVVPRPANCDYHTTGFQDCDPNDRRTIAMIARGHRDVATNQAESDAVEASLAADRATRRKEQGTPKAPKVTATPGPHFGAMFSHTALRPRAKWFTQKPPVMARRVAA